MVKENKRLEVTSYSYSTIPSKKYYKTSGSGPALSKAMNVKNTAKVVLISCSQKQTQRIFV